jgi:hypothetical protein
MRKILYITLLTILSFYLFACSDVEVMPLDGVWVSEDLSFEITLYEDDDDSFYVLTYLLGNAGTYTFDVENNQFIFFNRTRTGTEGNYIYHKEILSDEYLLFMMSYSPRSDVIKLLYLNIETEPIVFQRQT